MSIATLSSDMFEDMKKQAQVDKITFASLLREYRAQRRLSQSRLAEAAGFNHSYVSRLESGTRMPTRDAVAKLADAMSLSEEDHDSLLASAGFMPGRIENLFIAEPVLLEVFELLRNLAVPVEIRDDVRHIISLLIRQAGRAATAMAHINSTQR